MGWEDALRELEGLQAARGVWSEDLPRRIGPMLRKLAGIDDDADVVQSRELITAYLERLAVRLPPDLRLAVLAALAIEPGADNRKFLNGRWTWLVEQEGYALITARRRIEAGLRALAHEAVAGEPARDGWYVELLASDVSLIGGSLEAVEERRIRATVDGLRTLLHRTSVPREPGHSGEKGLEVEMLSGGALRLEATSATHFQYVVALHRPLNAGDRHTFTVRNRIPRGQVILPHYLCVPLCRYDRFDLTMRFNAGGVPPELRRVEGVPPRLVEDDEVTGVPLLSDPSGTIRTSFSALRQGFGYGATWSWT